MDFAPASGARRSQRYPYAQAFFLNISYDRRFYNPEYVLLEARGVRDAGRGGMTYWNNSGRYEDIPLPADF